MICDGLDITLGEFFSTPEFDRLEQEIKQAPSALRRFFSKKQDIPFPFREETEKECPFYTASTAENAAKPQFTRCGNSVL